MPAQGENEEIHILLVDDHPVVRDGIRLLLKRAKDLVIVGETGNGREVIPLMKELDPDVILLDMRLPGMSGLEIVQSIQDSKLHGRILALSAYADEEYVDGLLSAGVAGYLMKDEAMEMIVDAVRGTARGEKGWFSRRVFNRLVASSLDKRSSKTSGLTNRELEVLKFAADGKTNQEIAMRLDVSDKTVEKHLQKIFSKLGVASRVDAAVIAVRNGLI